MITTRMTTHPLANTLDRIGTLNRVLNQVLPEGLGSAAPLWVPPLEVAERADAYLIAVDLPGVREEELELGFESNVLTLRGSKRPSFSAAGDGASFRVHVAARQTGTFERSVRLPEYVEGGHIEARFVDGVLHVIVPKSPAAQPRKIPLTREPREAQQQQQQQHDTPADAPEPDFSTARPTGSRPSDSSSAASSATRRQTTAARPPRRWVRWRIRASPAVRSPDAWSRCSRSGWARSVPGGTTPGSAVGPCASARWTPRVVVPPRASTHLLGAGRQPRSSRSAPGLGRVWGYCRASPCVWTHATW